MSAPIRLDKYPTYQVMPPPPRQIVQRDPSINRGYNAPPTPVSSIRNFSMNRSSEYENPYRAADEEGFIGLTSGIENNLRQGRRTSSHREWMKTLQSQDRQQAFGRRRQTHLTPWMKWMNSEWKNHSVAMIGEFVGTTFFLFFGFTGITVAKTQSETIPNLLMLFYISATFGASVMVNAWVFFRISGGLFNPAVTLALLLVGAVDLVRAVLLILTQLGAACLAAFMVNVMFPAPVSIATTLGGGASVAQGFFIEVVITAMLIFTILMLAVEKHRGTFVAPIGIGLALFIGHMAAISYSGASLNPARSFGVALIHLDFPVEHWIYWLGPGLGAILAVLIWRLFKLLEYEMANPGQDGDPTNDPTQNPMHEVAQTTQARQVGLDKSIRSTSPGFRDGSAWGINQMGRPIVNINGGRLSPRADIIRRQDLESQGGMM